jgi:replication fork protection complex subunit Csm3/Swi3
LNYYQLWLDNLYPRAKFADGLQLVEKAGHSKRMQTMRKEWIDEGKPGYARDKLSTAGDTLQIVEAQESATAGDADTGRREGNEEAAARPVANQSTFGNGTESEELFVPDNNAKPSDSDDDAAPEDDELDALLAEQRSIRVSPHEPAEPESEGEDDLDALLAEQESRPPQPSTTTTKNTSLDEEDDLDALLAERDASSSGTGGAKAQEEPVEDGDGLDAFLAERESREADGADVGAQSSSPFPVIDEEDSGLVT